MRKCARRQPSRKTKILYSRNGRTGRGIKPRSQFGHLTGAEAVVKPTHVGRFLDTGELASRAFMVIASMEGFIMKRKIHRFFPAPVVVMIMMSLVLVAPSVVLGQTLTLNPTSGVPGRVITITGSGFAINTAGVVGFDS